MPSVDILPLVDGDALDMMQHLLAKQGRDLTAEQWGCVTASLDQATALYCRLAMRVVSKWTSTTGPAQCMLPPLVPTLVASILDGLEYEFCRPWTRMAPALITYSRAGVSDAEMQDLLSLNDERVLNHVFQYSKPDDVRRFPLHYSISDHPSLRAHARKLAPGKDSHRRHSWNTKVGIEARCSPVSACWRGESCLLCQG